MRHAVAALLGVSAVLTAIPGRAIAYQPQPPPWLEEASASPPGMPSPPAPAETAPAVEAPSEEAVPSPLSAEPLKKLAGHGRYWGLSLVNANGGHPLRRPRQLWLAFGTITDYGGEHLEEKTDEYAALFWEAGCNEHDYAVEATPTRLNLEGDGSTAVLCPGRPLEEERWLERFFAADPHWRLARGRLTLTARGSTIVMHHRPPRSS